MVSKINPKRLSPMFRREKSHKQNINNLKPKKYKHETTFEESFEAKIREEVECEYIERKKNLQQREYKVGQREHKADIKEHDFAMKQKWAKDNRKKICVNHSTESKEIFFSKFNPAQEKKYFLKSNSSSIRNNLVNSRNLNL